MDFFKKGSGELVAFVLILPILCLIIMFMATLIQITMARQNLEYVTYSIGRSAVITDDFAVAMQNAQFIASENGNFSISFYGYNDAGFYALSPDDWVKGNYVALRVTEKVKPLFPYLFSDTYYSVVVMMIE